MCISIKTVKGEITVDAIWWCFISQLSNENSVCEKTEIMHQASRGQLKQVSQTTNCSLTILVKDQRPLSMREEQYVSVSQRNGMAWLEAQ